MSLSPPLHVSYVPMLTNSLSFPHDLSTELLRFAGRPSGLCHE